MSDRSPVLADRYRLLGLIASGGVGEVWRAVDLVLNRPVAVKLLRAEYAEHPETLARFRAEAQHAGSLSHPGIAQVYDYSEAVPAGSPYLVMELVDGPSLAGVLAGGPLSPAMAMDVVAQAAAALDAAHAAGLVHRDIKPGNLLVGPGGQVKITDFGIAHAAGSAPITRTGMLVGTPAYLAPERAAGGPSTPASDLYSLGVLAYQCLAGKAPFHGTPLEIALAHQNGALPPLPVAVPVPVATLVADLTAKDPAARPASAAEVAHRASALRGSVADWTAAHAEPVTGRLPPTVTGPPAHRADDLPATRTDLPATRTDLPATLVGAAVSAPPPAPRRGRAWSRPRVVAVAVTAAVAAGLAGWLAASPAQRTPPGRVTAAPTTRHTATTPAARTVAVKRSMLVSQPVSAVRRQLRQLGLQTRVRWVRGGPQGAGTVVSVQPTGRVPVGSVVTLSVVSVPPGHVHGHGNGQGANSGD